MTPSLQSIPLSLLVPFGEGEGGQYRDAGRDLEELVDSIRESGLQVALRVRPHPAREGYYEVIAGHRRLLACRQVGLKEARCEVGEASDADAEVTVMLSNAARVDPLPWEQGEGFRRLIKKHGMSRAQVAAAFGLSVATVADRLTIAGGVGAFARESFSRGELTVEALVLLAKLPDRAMFPVKCPGCRYVFPEGTEVCPGCGYDLRMVIVFDGGNPQENGARSCKGLSNGKVMQIIEGVKEKYGLADKPMQTSVGMSEAEVRQAEACCKTRLETDLEGFCRRTNWLFTEAGKAEVAGYTDKQKAAARRLLDGAALQALKNAKALLA